MLKVPLDFEPYRRASPWDENDMGDRGNGFFRIPARQMTIVVSNGGGWEHVSISFKDRCPTWDEMEEMKRRFWAPQDTVMQLHVPVDEHRNCHPYCLHLWRPTKCEIPWPPSIYVAPPPLRAITDSIDVEPIYDESGLQSGSAGKLSAEAIAELDADSLNDEAWVKEHRSEFP